MRTSLRITTAIAAAVTLGACGNAGIGGIEGDAHAAFDNTNELVAAAKDSTQEHNTATLDMEMDMGAMSMEGSGEGRFDGADTAMAMTMQAMGEEVEIRLVDGVMYLKPPNTAGARDEALTPAEPDPDKPWVEMSLDDLPGGSADMLEYNDPRRTLELLEESGEITRTDEDVEHNGESATYYAIDVDADKLVEEFAPDVGGPARDELEQAELGTVPVELWLNSDNLPLQVTVSFADLAQSAVEQHGDSLPEGMDEATMTMTYRDWGEPVDVQAPPADEIGQAPAMPMEGEGTMPDGEMPDGEMPDIEGPEPSTPN